MEIVALHPDAAGILATYGLHCVGCAFNQLDTLEDGMLAHGKDEDDLNNLLVDLEELLLTSPGRPHTLTVTKPAAEALLSIAETEGKADLFLKVTSDESGGFCMEFSEEKEADDLDFSHPEVKRLQIISSPDTLFRIGGSTIDYRDGRFALDLLAVKAACDCGGKCDCKK